MLREIIEIVEEKQTLKGILAKTLPNFKHIDKFLMISGKFTIDGTHTDGTKVYKQLDMGSDITGIQKIVNALNKQLDKINKGLK